MFDVRARSSCNQQLLLASESIYHRSFLPSDIKLYANLKPECLPNTYCLPSDIKIYTRLLPGEVRKRRISFSSHLCAALSHLSRPRPSSPNSICFPRDWGTGRQDEESITNLISEWVALIFCGQHQNLYSQFRQFPKKSIYIIVHYRSQKGELA